MRAKKSIIYSIIFLLLISSVSAIQIFSLKNFTMPCTDITGSNIDLCNINMTGANITTYINFTYYINTTYNITNNITTYVNTTNNITNNITNNFFSENNITNNITNNYTTNYNDTWINQTFYKKNDVYNKSETYNRTEILGLIPSGLEYYYRNNVTVDSSRNMTTPTVFSSQVQFTFVSPTNGMELFNFSTGINLPSSIPDGVAHAHIHGLKVSGTKVYTMFYRLYLKNNTAETLLCTSEDSQIIATTQTDIDNSCAISKILPNVTQDRILLKYYLNITGTGTAGNLLLFIEGSTVSGLELPASFGSFLEVDPIFTAQNTSIYTTILNVNDSCVHNLTNVNFSQIEFTELRLKDTGLENTYMRTDAFGDTAQNFFNNSVSIYNGRLYFDTVPTVMPLIQFDAVSTYGGFLFFDSPNGALKWKSQLTVSGLDPIGFDISLGARNSTFNHNVYTTGLYMNNTPLDVYMNSRFNDTVAISQVNSTLTSVNTTLWSRDNEINSTLRTFITDLNNTMIKNNSNANLTNLTLNNGMLIYNTTHVWINRFSVSTASTTEFNIQLPRTFRTILMDGQLVGNNGASSSMLINQKGGKSYSVRIATNGGADTSYVNSSAMNLTLSSTSNGEYIAFNVRIDGANDTARTGGFFSAYPRYINPSLAESRYEGAFNFYNTTGEAIKNISFTLIGGAQFTTDTYVEVTGYS